MKPSIGRIIHYKNNVADPCVAGIITDVHDNDVISVTLFYPFKNAHCFGKIGKEGDPNPLNTMAGAWHEPERI